MRSQSEIDEQMNRASMQEEKGGSRYHGMTFEQGVGEALRWVTGQTEDLPIPDPVEEETDAED